jgi:hypothetical protein
VSDRADELRRQRRLLLEHLAWLEREIVAEDGSRPHEAEPVPQPAQEAYEPPILPPGPVDDRDAEAILAEYRTPAMSIAAKTKMGCVAYFAAFMLIVAVAVTLFYLYTRASHGR